MRETFTPAEGRVYCEGCPHDFECCTQNQGFPPHAPSDRPSGTEALSDALTFGGLWLEVESALPGDCVIESLYRIRETGKRWPTPTGWAVDIVDSAGESDEPRWHGAGATREIALKSVLSQIKRDSED